MITLENLTVKLDGFTLRNINLEIADGEYFIVVGPTGAGKTILLESIAGLYHLSEGRIWIRGRDITGLEPERRRISIVYQDYSLFPHLSVKDNILFGLRLYKTNQKETHKALEWIASLLNISPLLTRKPETLSGGERQKVSLARALIIKPDVLLLDEPLSALDQETKEAVREGLTQLHQTFGITTIHVTHDFEEAMSLGERIAVIGEGELKQVGTTEQVFRQPVSEFVARFAMVRNIFTGKVCKVGNDTIFKGKEQSILVGAYNIEGSCYATIRPEDFLVSLESTCPEGYNCLSGNITKIVDKGATFFISVDVPPEISCLIIRQSFEKMVLKIGKQVYLAFSPSSVHLFK